MEFEEQVTQFDKDLSDLLQRETQPIVNNIANSDHKSEISGQS